MKWSFQLDRSAFDWSWWNGERIFSDGFFKMIELGLFDQIAHYILSLLSFDGKYVRNLWASIRAAVEWWQLVIFTIAFCFTKINKYRLRRQPSAMNDMWLRTVNNWLSDETWKYKQIRQIKQSNSHQTWNQKSVTLNQWINSHRPNNWSTWFDIKFLHGNAAVDRCNLLMVTSNTKW